MNLRKLPILLLLLFISCSGSTPSSQDLAEGHYFEKCSSNALGSSERAGRVIIVDKANGKTSYSISECSPWECVGATQISRDEISLSGSDFVFEGKKFGSCL